MVAGNTKDDSCCCIVTVSEQLHTDDAYFEDGGDRYLKMEQELSGAISGWSLLAAISNDDRFITSR